VKVYAGTDPLTGREIRAWETGKTERAAQIELGRLREQAAAGRQPETDATMGALRLPSRTVATGPTYGAQVAAWLAVKVVGVVSMPRMNG
jgi:hypothetical protein